MAEQGNVRFTGVMPALVTPLRADESLNEAAVQQLIRWHLSEGMDGFYICGGTGEGPGLQKHVRMQMAEAACAETRGRGSVIVHVVPLSLPSAITDLSAFNSLTAVMSFVVLLVLVMVTV